MPMPSPAPSSPDNAAPAQRIAALCAIADELCDLIEEETRLLRGMRIDAIVPLQADKARLTQLCGTALKSIDPETPLTPALKLRWQQASKRLGDAAIANEMALRVGRAATDRLVGAIIDQVENQRRPAAGYERPQPRQGARYRPAALSGVAIDRRL
jgi:hypothetical protein